MINQPNNNAQLLNGVPANLSGITDGQLVGFDDGELVPVQGGTVSVDGTTIQGDGSSGSPLAVVAGVYDSYGAAQNVSMSLNTAATDANISTDGYGNIFANQINVLGNGVYPIIVNNGAAKVDYQGYATFTDVTLINSGNRLSLATTLYGLQNNAGNGTQHMLCGGSGCIYVDTNITTDGSGNLSVNSLVLLGQSAAPSVPVDGQMYYDGTHLYIYIAGNSAWTTII